MRILFYVDTIFPYGAAWSSRARQFAKLLKFIDYDVHIIAAYSSEESTIPDKVYNYEGYTYQVIKKRAGKIDRLIKPYMAMKQISEYLKSNKVDAVLSTRCPDIFDNLYKLLDEREIPLYIEQCEWLDKKNFKLGKFDPYYIKLNRSIKHKFHKSTGIIAISTLLENHYINKGAKVIRIPTILDMQQTDYSLNASADEKIRLVFAGNIGGKKELMSPIFKAIDMLGPLSKRIELNIFGPSEKAIIENIDKDSDMLKRVSKSVKIHGRVHQLIVNQHLMKADFMIFIRPDRKSSNAGFPTKFAERLAAGTPVITNITSDIGKYLINGENGYIVKDTSEESVAEVLMEVMKLSKDEIERMKTRARDTAEKAFDYRNYADTLKYFL